MEQRPPLRRATAGRMVAGVARGVAVHLGVDVWWVRSAFVVLSLTGGAGILAYGALWLLVPLDADDAVDDVVRPGTPGRTTAAPVSSSPADPLGREGPLLLLLGTAGVVLGVVVGAAALGLDVRFLWPLVVVGLGAALVWMQSDDDQRDRLRSGMGWVAPEGRTGVLQVVAGVTLVVTGVVAFVVGGYGVAEAGQVFAAVAVVLLGIALVGGPFALRLLRQRDAERRARIRGEERAELAAQVHDSVLQSLTLIQRNAGDPAEVGRIARAQERDLRRWLYEPEASATASLRGALSAMVAEVEDTHGVTVELVCVGDATVDERMGAVVQAAREAVVNAAKHTGGPVSVFAEVGPDQVEVFVRDRGPGFVVADVPADRLGVRESIMGRMERNGGAATVLSEPGEGTRIELRMDRGR